MTDYMKNYLPIRRQQEWCWGASGTKEEMNLTRTCSDVEAATWWLCGMDSTTYNNEVDLVDCAVVRHSACFVGGMLIGMNGPR